MKKLLMVGLSLLCAQQAHGLQKELKHLSESLNKLAEDLVNSTPPPAPPLGVIPAASPKLTPEEIAELEKDRPKRPLPPPPVRKYTLPEIKMKLDEILNEKDTKKLIDPRNQLGRSYLVALEKKGAPQEDVIKYKDLYVRYTKNRLDVMLQEAREKRLPLNLRFANLLLASLRDHNVSEDDIESYSDKISNILSRPW